MNPPRLLFAAASLALLLVIGACVDNRAQVQASDDVEVQSGAQQHSLDVPEEATSLELSLDIETTSGEIAWTLSDPTGALVESGAVRAGEQDERTIPLAPSAGAWDLQLELRDATGSYDLRLQASW